MGSAVLSECGMYRYRLERDSLPPLPQCILDEGAFHPLAGKTIAFFGVNPSTADASVDDATVRKWIGFCRRWGVSRFIVGNVFSYRATDVRHLAEPIFAKGPDHRAHLDDIIRDADVLIPCWGNSSKVPPRLRQHVGDLLRSLQLSGKPMLHFGLTASGDPKHPLMLGYGTPLTPWSAK